MGYTKEAIKGISWLGIFRVTTRLFSYAKVAVIARILTPEQYGTSDIALMILSLSEILTETGINIFLTQKKEDIGRYINTAWVVSIFRGFLISVIIAAWSPIIAKFYNSPAALYVLLMAAVIPLIRGFINPSVIKFTKDLQFSKEFSYRTSIFLVESLAAMIIAIITRSATAIVISLVIGAIYEVLVSFISVKPRPVFRFNKTIFIEIIQGGKWLTATGIFNYLYHNGDNLVIGKLIGVGSVGIYTRAYSISMLPITEVSDVVSKVTFPVFVKFADDKKRLRRAYFRTMASMSLISISMGLLFFLFPEKIVYVILGPQWTSAIEPLKVLAVFGVIRSVSISSVAPFYAVRRQDIITRVTFVSFMGLLLTIVPFVQTWGLVGAAYSALTGALISLPVIMYYFYKTFIR